MTMEQDKNVKNTPPSSQKNQKEKANKEAEIFKRKYFEFYDDIKISVKEDW